MAVRALDDTVAARGRDLDLGGLALKSSALASIRKSTTRASRTPRPWEPSTSTCRTILWPGCSENVPAPPAHRASAADAGRWPRHVERTADMRVRGLIPRGTLFDQFIHDPVEPRRSGVYEFCVVGVDITQPGPPHYYAWEPTGHFDRTFTAHELDRKLAMERFGRSVNLESRQRVDMEAAHRKYGSSMDAAIKWPDSSLLGSLMCAYLLPDLDERGRPVLPQGSRFPPRNSIDILQPMLFRLKHFYQPSPGVEDQRILVLDGTGRFAAQVQDEFLHAHVEAVDDHPKFFQQPLKMFRDRSHFPVPVKGFKLREGPVFPLADRSADVVILPFVCHRLCHGDPEHYLRLIREACRVAKFFVVLVEDVVAPTFDANAVDRYKAFLLSNLSASILADSELRSGPVPDHFLSESGTQDSVRRSLIIKQSAPGLEVCNVSGLSERLGAQRLFMQE